MSLSSQLQDYLSRNGKSSSGNGGSHSRDGGVGGGAGFSLFGLRREPSDSGDHPSQMDDDADSGWFTSAQSDPLLPSLTKKQRVLGFIGCLLMGTFCISLASLYIPFLLLKARKFAMLYTLGSLFVIASFSLLWGPVNHVKHLFSAQRLPFTVSYFGAMFGTLYFALSVQSTVLTILFAIAQILALVWFVVSYVPGGQTGLKFFSKIFYAAASKTVQKTLPV